MSEQNALTRLEERLDLVPTRLNRDVVKASGYTEAYLLKLCNENGIKLGDLKDMIQLTTRYKCNLNTIVKLMDSNYSIEDIGSFLHVREELTIKDKGRSVDLPSLSVIASFYRAFDSEPLEDESLATTIQDVHSRIKNSHKRGKEKRVYTTQSLALVLDTAERLGTYDLETVMSHLTDEGDCDEYNPDSEDIVDLAEK